MSSERTLWIGGNDLRFLGMIAAIAARTARRRAGFLNPDSDIHALDQLIFGIQLGRDIPLDDLPTLPLGVTADGEVMKWIRRVDQRAGFFEMGFSAEEVDGIIAELEGPPQDGSPIR